MPLYQFEDTRTGNLVELERPVAQRDCVPKHLKRVQVPTFAIHLGRLDPAGADVAVPRALKQLEAGGKSASQIAKETGFSVPALKRIWKM